MSESATPRSDIYAAQDDCLIAITDGRPLPADALSALPPWRAVLCARVAAKAGVGLERGTLEQLVSEAEAVTRSLDGAALGEWWMRG